MFFCGEAARILLFSLIFVVGDSKILLARTQGSHEYVFVRLFAPNKIQKIIQKTS